MIDTADGAVGQSLDVADLAQRLSGSWPDRPDSPRNARSLLDGSRFRSRSRRGCASHCRNSLAPIGVHGFVENGKQAVATVAGRALGQFQGSPRLGIELHEAVDAVGADAGQLRQAANAGYRSDTTAIRPAACIASRLVGKSEAVEDRDAKMVCSVFRRRGPARHRHGSVCADR